MTRTPRLPDQVLACSASPDLFSDNNDPTAVREALTLCRRCPVRVACHQGALLMTKKDRARSTIGGVHFDKQGNPNPDWWRKKPRKQPWKPGMRGEDSDSARGTDTKVREARRLHASGTSCYALARAYGVDQSTMRLAVAGKTWSHLKDEVPA